MRIIFAGTPQFAAVILQALIAGPHANESNKVVAVYTQPDRPAGRGQHTQASEVKQLAEQHHIPVYQPLSLQHASVIEQIKELAPDLMVVAVYGTLLPQAVLDIPKLGCLNVHASLLPHWRGAAPIARAIAAGDKKIGISMMKMVAALDAGPVWEEFPLSIEETDTHASLGEKLSVLAAQHINDTINKIAKEQLKAIPQDDSKSTYAPKLTKAEGLIDWALPAETIERHVRAYNPWPVAYTHIDSQLIRVWAAEIISTKTEHKPGTLVNMSAEGLDVSTGTVILRLQEIQLSGKSRIRAGELYKTKHPLFKIGSIFHS